MSVAPSSFLLLTANWQHSIKPKRGGQLFFFFFFLSLIDSSIEDIFKGNPWECVLLVQSSPPIPCQGTERGCKSALIGQRLQSLLNPHRAAPRPVTALTPTSTRPSTLNMQNIFTLI